MFGILNGLMHHLLIYRQIYQAEQLAQLYSQRLS